MSTKYDFIIIGAGIIGASLARELSKYDSRILIIEKNSDIGMGTSSANSAIIHAGHDPRPGTLKAALNFRGNLLWPGIADNLHIPFRRCGSYVVAIGAEEDAKLLPMIDRAKINKIEGIKLLSKEEMLEREPLLNPETSSGLFMPSAGIIDPFTAVLAVTENAVRNGVTLLRETEFLDFIFEKEKITGIKTTQGDFSGRWTINCSGLYSDKICASAKVRPNLKIIPRKGEYLVMDNGRFKMDKVLFPVPGEGTKGTVVTTTMHGNVIVGPNAVEVDNRDDRSTSIEGMDFIFDNGKRLIPSLDRKLVIAQFAGIRASVNTEEKDFIIETYPYKSGFLNIAGIDSPGLASAPAIAEYAVKILESSGEKLKKRTDFTDTIPVKPCFRRMTDQERRSLCEKDPAYSRIVCRCENITEGEVRDALTSPVPALDYDSVKRKTWLGTGRCQGSFDYPIVLDMISQHRQIPMTSVTKKGRGSEFLMGPVREIPHDS